MEVIFRKNFKKQYKKLPQSIQRIFKKKVGILKKDPRNILLKNHKLKGGQKGFRSINVTGDYRATYRVEEGVFYRIGTHSQLYT